MFMRFTNNDLLIAMGENGSVGQSGTTRKRGSLGRRRGR